MTIASCLESSLPRGRQACEAGRAGTWTGEDIRREVDEFVQRAVLYAAHELLPAAVGGDTDIPLWYEVKEELRRSEEWTTHLQERTQVARGQFAPDDGPRISISLDSPEGRKAAVDASIKEVLDETGLKITRKDIWEKVGYNGASTPIVPCSLMLRSASHHGDCRVHDTGKRGSLPKRVSRLRWVRAGVGPTVSRLL